MESWDQMGFLKIFWFWTNLKRDGASQALAVTKSRTDLSDFIKTKGEDRTLWRYEGDLEWT
jgi:hypothetical protein